MSLLASIFGGGASSSDDKDEGKTSDETLEPEESLFVYTKGALSALSPDQRDVIVQRLQSGIGFNAKPLLPLTEHNSLLWLFHDERLSEYVAQHQILEQVETNTLIEGNSLNEFRNAFASQLLDQIDYAAAVLSQVADAEVAGAVAGDPRIYNREEVTLRQNRRLLTVLRVCLPLPIAGSRDDIRGLLSDFIKEKIDAISTCEEAKHFLLICGHFFVHTVGFGSARISTEVMMPNIIRTGVRSESKNDEFKDTIVECHFKPVHELALPGSKAESLLRNESRNYFHPIVNYSPYAIQNRESERYLCFADDNHLVRVVIVNDYLSEDNRLLIVLASYPDHSYLQRTSCYNIKWVCQCGTKSLLKVSKESYTDKRRNQWVLIRIEDNVFLIQSVSRTYFLCGRSLELTLEPVPKHVALADHSFHWRFEDKASDIEAAGVARVVRPTLPSCHNTSSNVVRIEQALMRVLVHFVVH